MILEINGLNKYYGSKHALKDFSFTFHPGIYGILGNNGAGKSTLFGLLTDTLKRDSGNILADGSDILEQGSEYRRKIGYMPQVQSYYPEMTVKEFLFYVGTLKDMKHNDIRRRFEELAVQLDFSDFSSKKMKALSGGMRQRVMLAQALLSDAQLLILDEPTAGVDPLERIHIRNIISSVSAGRIVLIATHIVTDLECIAKEVLVMRKGKIAAAGTPEALIRFVTPFVYERNCSDSEAASLYENYPNSEVIQTEHGLLLRTVGPECPDGFHKAEQRITLEEVYLYCCRKRVRR